MPKSMLNVTMVGGSRSVGPVRAFVHCDTITVAQPKQGQTLKYYPLSKHVRRGVEERYDTLIKRVWFMSFWSLQINLNDQEKKNLIALPKNRCIGLEVELPEE
jgi:hypothetical protein